MVRSELVTKLAHQFPGVLRKDLERILEIIFLQILEALSRGENIEIRGFGTYKIIKRKARIGRNPKTGEQIQIAASRKVKWKMGKTLYKRLNKNFAEDQISAINKN